MSTATFPSDPGQVVQSAMVEPEFVQSVNTSEVEVTGIMGLIGRLVDVETNASLKTGDHVAQQMVSEQQAITHSATAENAGDMGSFTANVSAAEARTNEAIRHSVSGNVSAAVADEAGAKAAALEQVSNVTLAQIKREMLLHSVIEEIAVRDAAAAEHDLEAEAVKAAVDKDATVSPFKLG